MKTQVANQGIASYSRLLKSIAITMQKLRSMNHYGALSAMTLGDGSQE